MLRNSVVVLVCVICGWAAVLAAAGGGGSGAVWIGETVRGFSALELSAKRGNRQGGANKGGGGGRGGRKGGRRGGGAPQRRRRKFNVSHPVFMPHFWNHLLTWLNSAGIPLRRKHKAHLNEFLVYVTGLLQTDTFFAQPEIQVASAMLQAAILWIDVWKSPHFDRLPSSFRTVLTQPSRLTLQYPFCMFRLMTPTPNDAKVYELSSLGRDSLQRLAQEYRTFAAVLQQQQQQQQAAAAGQAVEQPGVGVQQPGVGVQQPGVGVQQPGAMMQQPGAMMQQPGVGVQQPGAMMQQPGAMMQQPGVGVQQPAEANFFLR